MLKSYYRQHRYVISNDFYVTLNVSTSYFYCWTCLNNNGLLIKERRQQRFLNEHHLLISSAIQWNLFHRLHFSLKLSKSFINMTGFCATPNFSASFFEYRTCLDNNGFPIRQRCQQRFLNKHHLLISSAIQWNLFHRLPFQFGCSTFLHILKSLQRHDSQADWGRELFKPSVDSASLQLQVK